VGGSAPENDPVGSCGDDATVQGSMGWRHRVKGIVK
jgi:hypothetical protein